MTHWKVTIKEVGNPNLLVSDNISPMSRKDIIDFYGLENAEVEWYEIEIVKD